MRIFGALIAMAAAASPPQTGVPVAAGQASPRVISLPAQGLEADRLDPGLRDRVMSLGGTPSGTAEAREDSWRHMLTFIDEHLSGMKPALGGLYSR